MAMAAMAKGGREEQMLRVLDEFYEHFDAARIQPRAGHGILFTAALSVPRAQAGSWSLVLFLRHDREAAA